MGLQVDDVINITYKGSLFGQTIMCVLRAVITSAESSNTVHQDLDNILQTIKANSITTPIGRMVVCQGGDVTWTKATVQRIYPVRTTYVSEVINITGSAEGTCDTANVAAVLTKQSLYVGKRGRGSVHIAGLVTADYAEGLIETTLAEPMAEFGTVLIGEKTTTPASNCKWKYCTSGGAIASSTTLSGFVVQPEVRIMRRRTVGRGI